MTIKDIYFGIIPVTKLIQNGKVIWESIKPIHLRSIAVSTSNAEGIYNYFAFLPSISEAKSVSHTEGYISLYNYIVSMQGDSQSEIYAEGVGNMFDLFSIKGKALNESDTAAYANLLNVLFLDGDSETASYVKGGVMALSAIIGKSDTMHTSGTKGDSYVLGIRLAKSKAESKNRTQGLAESYRGVFAESKISEKTYVTGKGKSAYRTRIRGSTQERTYQKAKGFSYDAALCMGKIEMNPDSQGQANVFEIMRLNGFDVMESNTKALLDAFNAVLSRSEAQTSTYLFGSVNALQSETIKSDAESVTIDIGNVLPATAIIGQSKDVSQSNGKAKIKLLYLPYLAGNTLYIRSAYNAKVTDGILSIT